jgi:hypothetical protein
MDEDAVTSIYRDKAGREFHFIYVDNGTGRLGIHFSAFFGDWGDDPKYRASFGGYFHRRNMLGSSQEFDWLFLCDAFGADKNGTYYTGKWNDLFVEDAMFSIIESVGVGTKYFHRDVFTIGSSMGATAALKFGLSLNATGIIAISPHIDLDICAKTQGRQRHVAWILDSEDTDNAKFHGITRQIRTWLEHPTDLDLPLPQLFIQSCKDDLGVHQEQVVPLARFWHDRNCVISEDFRRFGGHTSIYATRSLLLEVARCFFSAEEIPLRSLRIRSEYLPGSIFRLYQTNFLLVLSRLKQRYFH